jgi:hypothetical protein
LERWWKLDLVSWSWFKHWMMRRSLLSKRIDLKNFVFFVYQSLHDRLKKLSRVKVMIALLCTTGNCFKTERSQVMWTLLSPPFDYLWIFTEEYNLNCDSYMSPSSQLKMPTFQRLVDFHLALASLIVEIPLPQLLFNASSCWSHFSERNWGLWRVSQLLSLQITIALNCELYYLCASHGIHSCVRISLWVGADVYPMFSVHSHSSFVCKVQK